MKKVTILTLLCLATVPVFSQNLSSSFYKNGMTTFNDFLYQCFKENPALKDADTLCMESCAFVKITVTARKVSGISFSRFTPSVISETIEKAVARTNGFWLDTDTTVYLLPVVYVFESNCRPVNRSSVSVLQMLRDLSGDGDVPAFPGAATEKPMACLLLNPFLLKSF